jgi:protein-S-isoprenylcysteine O-methyltransferase Ste14
MLLMNYDANRLYFLEGIKAMSLTPVLEVGMWNAWIFMLIYALHMPILMRIHKGVLKDSLKLFSKAQNRIYYVGWVIWILVSVYSIFLPLRLGTLWLYVGLHVTLLGAAAYVMVTISFVNTPPGKEPMTKGLYRYFRHPGYISQLIVFIGAGIASASWLFLLLTIVYTALELIYVGTEEQMCLERYGNAYREYMSRTPRWIGIPESKI